MTGRQGESVQQAREHLMAAWKALLPASNELHHQWGRFVGGAEPVFNHLDLMGAVDVAESRISAALLALDVEEAASSGGHTEAAT